MCVCVCAFVLCVLPGAKNGRGDFSNSPGREEIEFFILDFSESKHLITRSNCYLCHWLCQSISAEYRFVVLFFARYENLADDIQRFSARILPLSSIRK